jgi:cytochrome P450
MVLEIPFADAFRLDPSSEWSRLREEEPVVRVRTLAGSVVWLVTRYDDVRLVLADPRFSRAGLAGDDAPRVALARPLPNGLTTTDPPEHTRLRRLVSGTFAHRKIEQTRPWISSLAEALADDVAAAGDGADLRRLFALPLPIAVICHLLGVPVEDQDRFRAWTELSYTMDVSDAGRVDTAIDGLVEYIGKLVDAKPSTGLLAELIPQDGLTRDELVAFGVSLLVAGHETSANQIALAVAVLLRDPAVWDRLVAEPSSVPSAVEELLRINRLSEVGQLRVAVEDIELSGVTIRAGDGVIAGVNAANRDPRVFPDPDRLDLTRNPNPHLSFGAGPHFCLGAQLARIEMQESLNTLLRRFPRMRLATPATDLPWRRVLVTGLASLPVTLDFKRT